MESKKGTNTYNQEELQFLALIMRKDGLKNLSLKIIESQEDSEQPT